MRFYTRIARNLGVSFGFGLILLTLIGALFYGLTVLAIIAAMWGIALLFGGMLILFGVTYKALTGKNARIPVPGSVDGTNLEDWMEAKGWIRLPKSQRLRPLTHTQIMLQLYGPRGNRRKEIKH